MKFLDKFSEFSGTISAKLEQNKYLAAIKESFTIYLPFVIIGSFSLLFKLILTSTTTGLAQFETFKWLTILEPAFNFINFATMDIMALLISGILAYNLARANEISVISAIIVAIGGYVITVPQFVEAFTEKGEVSILKALPVSSTNAQGLFTGMIITILVIELYTKLLKIEKLKIKMPDSVPTGISASFNNLIPIFITFIIVAIASVLFVNFTGQYINQIIYTLIQEPLQAVVQTPAGIIILVLVNQIFWLIGIHGGLVISPIRNPLLIAALAANIDQMNAGLVPTNPVTMGFWMVFIVPGGAGYTLSLIIALLLASKKEAEKSIAKVSFLPGLFGISEPIVFGLPLIYNPVFAIPFVLASPILTGVAMFFNSIGFITPNVIDVPFGVPILGSAFLGYGWKGVVVQILLLGLGVLIYLPFVLASNRVKDVTLSDEEELEVL
ncbi:PTS sugar transporter subunit IIC [Helcococcus kunzii]|uniref:PTS sugar transporter subunit IIC n=1 Tax=Helcococcus kunzii TaxID=40091 RepID=UPI0024AE09D6|nr:PTS transporter subunit EIIC [Helcococcus kunzii]